MSLFNIFDIAGSGMSAQALRLNTVSSNLANASSVSGNPNDVYRAREPVFSAVLEGASNGAPGDPADVGVKVMGVVEKQTPPIKRYEPSNPLANKDGYVYQSNVNSIEEMANMISASRTFQNNVQVLKTTKQLLQDTLKLGQ